MTVKFYVGYDSTCPQASKVCYDSINKWVDDVQLLKLDELSVYKRARDPNQATEFSFTRFLVPYLNNYKGWAVFCDGDFLWINDPSALSQYCDSQYAVLCVKHDISPEHLTDVKMDGKKQLWYPRKNWSSLMLFNCEHPLTKHLTPDAVNTFSAGYLHQMEWAETAIGELPTKFNHLVGYYPPSDDICALHYTDGIPLYTGYENCEYSDVWLEYYNH